MGKRGLIKDREADTTVLYRKSNQNLIQSRTCSGSSELYTKSGILQIKKRLAQSQNESKEKIKRDLSIETDICILRRYCKKKMNKVSVDGSGKSKYSTIIDTEIGTIEEFLPDTSACGDSEPTDVANNVLLDTTKIMMNNLKDLLNDWILKHLMSNHDTKSKLETALYSLLHNTENDKTNTSSSRSTYVLNRDSLCQEVKNKKVATNSLFCKHSKHKSQKKKGSSKNLKSNTCKDPSCHSSPGSHKIYRIISTLSVPRNMHKQSIYKNEDKSKTTKSIRQRNLMLSINKSSKLIDISSFDLLTISTKSFTKRCATYDPEDRRKKKIRQIVFLPNASYKSITDSNYDTEDIMMNKTENTPTENNLDDMPSIVKSLFASDPANKMFNTSGKDNVNYSTHDNYTMTDLNISLQQYSTLKINNFQSTKSITNKPLNPVIVTDFLNDNNIFPNKKSVFSQNGNSTDPRYGTNMKTKNYKKNKTKSRNKVLKSHKIRNKCSTSNKKHLDAQNFINLCQNTLKYFADYEGNKNMKLNIEIKIVPTVDPKNQDKCTVTSRHNINISDICKSDRILCNLEPIKMDLSNETRTEKCLNFTTCCSKPEKENNGDIIPLLDSAASQTKYIFKTNSSTVKTDGVKHSVNCSTITDGEIIKDINELKIIIKDMTKAAESLVKEHEEEPRPSQVTNKKTSTSENLSKEVQLKNEPCKQPLLSGIKLSKEPRKDISEFYNRIMRKSTSYNVIDSESVIRVTDMTSAANSFKAFKRSGNALRRSCSLNEMTSCNKNKFLTYCCDECKDRKVKVNYSTRSENSMSSSCQVPKRRCGTKGIRNSAGLTKPTTYMPVYLDNMNDVVLVKPKNCGRFIDANSLLVCSSSNNDVDAYDFNCCNNCDEEKGTAICVRRITTKQGFFYCFLLWLPVLIVFVFFCMVLSQRTSNPPSKFIPLTQENNDNRSRFIVKASDLGF